MKKRHFDQTAGKEKSAIMTIEELQNHPWKVHFNHGCGQTTVYGITETEALANAVAYVRGNMALVESRTASELVKSIKPISQN